MRADGFLKFRKIRLNNIPRRGLIGLIGPNESGKSSLGQLIQYALFGTTHKMTRGSIVDLIHWEEDHCIVELDLEHDGECYRIWREMDRLGSSYARLLRLDPEDLSTGEEVAAGVLQVQKEVFRRFQLGATETLHSFYLAERESVTSPEDFREFLDRVAGIDVLHGASRKVQVAIDDLESVFTTNQTEIQRNDTHISRLQPNIEKIPEIENEIESRESRIDELQEEARGCHSQVQSIEKQRDEVSKIQKEFKALDQLSSAEAQRKCNGLIGLLQADLAPEPIKDSGDISLELQQSLEKLSKAHECRVGLNKALDSARSSLEEKLSDDHANSFLKEIQRLNSEINQLNSSHLRHRAMALVTFLAGLLFIVVGLDHELDWGFSQFLPLLMDLDQEKGTGFLLSAFGAALFVFSSWLWSKASLDKQNAFDSEGHVARLEMERDVAGASLESTRAHDAHGGHGIDPGDDISNCRLRGVQDALEALREERRGILALLGEQPGESLSSKLQPVIEKVRKALRSQRKKLDEVNEALKRIKSKRDRLTSQVREYQNQEGRRKALEEVNDGLRVKSLEIRSEMDVHRLLMELFEETIESVRLRTGPSLGKGLCRLLPHLTGGRYRDAQVTQDFEIRLFTGAKSDFLQTHELSGGTLQGLTFGFRLAFAQAYVKAVTGAPQFMFLDEPFPAMDRDRVLHTLGALPRLSRELSQIFLAHPDLESEARNCFDHVIDTELGRGELNHDFLDSDQGQGGHGTDGSRNRKPLRRSRSGRDQRAAKFEVVDEPASSFDDPKPRTDESSDRRGGRREDRNRDRSDGRQKSRKVDAPENRQSVDPERSSRKRPARKKSRGDELRETSADLTSAKSPVKPEADRSGDSTARRPQDKGPVKSRGNDDVQSAQESTPESALPEQGKRPTRRRQGQRPTSHQSVTPKRVTPEKATNPENQGQPNRRPADPVSDWSTSSERETSERKSKLTSDQPATPKPAAPEVTAPPENQRQPNRKPVDTESDRTAPPAKETSEKKSKPKNPGFNPDDWVIP